jgi:hypothetical protein
MSQQGAPDQDPSVWARPGSPSSAVQPVAPAELPTTSTPPAFGPRPVDLSHQVPAQPDILPTAQDHPGAPRYDRPPLPFIPQYIAAPAKIRCRFLRDPLSVILAVVILLALLSAGLIGAEIYARKRANSVVAAAVECEVKDKAMVHIGVGASPFLLQYFTGHYTDISIHTAGNRIRNGKGMKADITLDDLNLHGSANSSGTIGAVDATITWTLDGIEETVQDAVPFGGLLINSVKTSPATGTIELSAPWGLGSVTLKPRIAGSGVSLEIVQLTARRAAVRHETAQRALDAVTSKLTNGYPLGVRADSVQVTNDSVVTHLSARNAVIPAETDPCFAGI